MTSAFTQIEIQLFLPILLDWYCPSGLDCEEVANLWWWQGQSGIKGRTASVIRDLMLAGF